MRAAVNSDGVGCIVCHSQQVTYPRSCEGGGPLPVDAGGEHYGVQYGPMFSNPDPLPQRAHGIDDGRPAPGIRASPDRSSAAPATT